jgi:branched-subunit amino acid permease
MKFNKSLYAFSSSILESVANLFTIIYSVFIFSLRVFFIRNHGVQSFLLANFHIVATKIIGIFKNVNMMKFAKFGKFCQTLETTKLKKKTLVWIFLSIIGPH